MSPLTQNVDDMFGMLNDLQAPIEYEEETEDSRLEEEMSMNVEVDIDEDKTKNTSRFLYVEESVILVTQAHHVFYVDDPKFGNNCKVVQVIQNKRIWDVSEVDDVQNEHINILEVVVSHQVDDHIEDDHIEDDILCRIDVDPTIVERSVVRHLTDDFIYDVADTCHMQGTTTKYTDKPCTHIFVSHAAKGCTYKLLNQHLCPY
ncbi:acidic leucine-rich nuclear phosphoprotein 32 family member A-like [Cucumis melo var. makuwa]|uniref:Acidic leucine-rich nuclear phosphoprotein 32 family member A-like n=1 Tax=Cucumis melo var. makuwa TaxID=1194695 RepID=A0A5D3DEY7_CUCMM|nr:acidic leucine-rich nuclear phosphoprotein 32 family member A-like [Cucumis melo var. makuwa]